MLVVQRSFTRLVSSRDESLFKLCFVLSAVLLASSYVMPCFISVAACIVQEVSGGLVYVTALY